MKNIVWTLVIGAALALAACGGAAKPTSKLVDAQAALRAADEVGADKVPQGDLHMKLAREQLERADHLMKDGDNERAAGVLERAKADAELAMALSRRAEAERELASVENVATNSPAQ